MALLAFLLPLKAIGNKCNRHVGLSKMGLIQCLYRHEIEFVPSLGCLLLSNKKFTDLYGWAKYGCTDLDVFQPYSHCATGWGIRDLFA